MMENNPTGLLDEVSAMLKEADALRQDRYEKHKDYVEKHCAWGKARTGCMIAEADAYRTALAKVRAELKEGEEVDYDLVKHLVILDCQVEGTRSNELQEEAELAKVEYFDASYKYELVNAKLQLWIAARCK